MTGTASNSAAGPARQELYLTRILGTPRNLVFKAWTDREHVARRWGPRGFANPVCKLDFRPGGLMRIDMRGPDGMVYPMKGVFHEIVEPERLVYEHEGGDGIDAVKFRSTVTFAEMGGKTNVTLRMVFATAAERDFVIKKHGAIEGGKQTLARLAEQLEG
ncbi:MAG: SRPBCC family protein [Candidatus Acidiferrum sp.]|jgi:uncharacterized protein YndB with AHSA1/START domain